MDPNYGTGGQPVVLIQGAKEQRQKGKSIPMKDLSRKTKTTGGGEAGGEAGGSSGESSGNQGGSSSGQGQGKK